MHIEFLIFGLIVLILGIAISGIVGNILLIVGILILLYAIFSRGKSREEIGRIDEIPYEDADYNRNVNRSPPTPNEKKINSENRIRDDNPAESGVKVIELEYSKECTRCGSTNNPENARFCADCGKKLHE